MTHDDRFQANQDAHFQEISELESLRAQLAEKDLELARLHGLLNTLQFCEANYRKLHDTKGGSNPETGRAWDLMRRAGNAARSAALKGKDDANA